MGYTSGSGSSTTVDNITITKDANQALTLADPYFEKQANQDIQLLNLEAANSSGLQAFVDTDAVIDADFFQSKGTGGTSYNDETSYSSISTDFDVSEGKPVGIVRWYGYGGNYRIQIDTPNTTNNVDKTVSTSGGNQVNVLKLTESDYSDLNISSGTFTLTISQGNGVAGTTSSVSGNTSGIITSIPSTNMGIPGDTDTFVEVGDLGFEALSGTSSDIYIYSPNKNGDVELNDGQGSSATVSLNARHSLSFNPTKLVDINSLGLTEYVVLYL